MDEINHDRRTGDDRGVSPVIGAILMVAITVIMAAAIGTFVLDFGGSAGDETPQATLGVTTNAADDYVNVTHRGGDGIDAGRSRVVVTNRADGNRITFGPGDDPDVFAVGDVVAFDADDGNVTSRTWAGVTADSGSFDVESGVRYSVQVIDTRSQRIVFETTVTA